MPNPDSAGYIERSALTAPPLSNHPKFDDLGIVYRVELTSAEYNTLMGLLRRVELILPGK